MRLNVERYPLQPTREPSKPPFATRLLVPAPAAAPEMRPDVRKAASTRAVVQSLAAFIASLRVGFLSVSGRTLELMPPL
jgi:hypothetical protein